MAKCRWCNGRGYCYVEHGSSLTYRCPDCGGSGYEPECDVCGRVYSGDYCEECYAKCEYCGEVYARSELNDENICENCADELAKEKQEEEKGK